VINIATGAILAGSLFWDDFGGYEAQHDSMDEFARRSEKHFDAAHREKFDRKTLTGAARQIEASAV
jgi:hypothetical protein